MHNFEKCKQWNKKFISIFIQWRLHNLYKYKTVPNELFEHIYTYVDVLWNKYRSYEYQCVNESEQLSHHETHSHMQTYTRGHSETILTSFKINNNSRTFTIKATPCTFYTAPYSTAQYSTAHKQHTHCTNPSELFEPKKGHIKSCTTFPYDLYFILWLPSTRIQMKYLILRLFRMNALTELIQFSINVNNKWAKRTLGLVRWDVFNITIHKSVSLVHWS